MEVSSTKHILSNCLILSAISWIVMAQMPQNFRHNPCKSKSMCHECIQTPSCAWCSDPAFRGGNRCLQSSDILANKVCREEFVNNPDNVLDVLENLQLGRVGVAENSIKGVQDRIVQVEPQKLKLKIRSRQTHKVGMKYSQVQGYPVDLYYLMDLSKSSTDKNKLYTLGDQLMNAMTNLTSNFRLGVGSLRLIKPWDQGPTFYEFYHHMTLSSNTHKFLHMVKQANVSKNIDAPEGGIDAIMQAVVCKNEIGWREQARRFLVFASDVNFHFAEDGKSSGKLKPNDGYCHLPPYGIYTESSSQDYPSIEQVNLSAKKNFITIIFAVNQSAITMYEQLARNIEGAAVGKLERDSTNIIELIKEQIQQISSTVEMKHNASSAVSLKFSTRCMNSAGALVNINKCGNVKVGDIIHFEIDIEIVKCPKNPADYFQTIMIYPVGIADGLIIDLEMLCECDCEKPGHKFYEVNSSSCFHHGTSKCGICECEPRAYGKRCECVETESEFTMTDCMGLRNTNGLECSGRGQCVCGHCQCFIRSNENEEIYGRYCECDNFSCERHNGKLCSDHGTCECGVCACNEQWTGPSCACNNSRVNCYPPGSNTVICSGHGICECGQCVCDHVEEGRYTGKFCEKLSVHSL